jgi:Fe-Mn family superoxide dismutase
LRAAGHQAGRPVSIDPHPEDRAMAIEAKSFPLEGKLKGISDRQLQEHRDVLYKGYVAQYNNIVELLGKADSSKANPHFSEWGELKRRETWAHNGTILHQWYFENLAAPGTTQPGARTSALVERDFGSLDKLRADLLNAGKVAPVGWAVWAWSALDRKTHVYLLEQHMNHCPIGVVPLLVLDVFEHAYFLDHATKRADYLNAFWDDVDWNAVEERTKLVPGA